MTRRARLVPANIGKCHRCHKTWPRPMYLWHDDTTDTLTCGECAGTNTTGPDAVPQLTNDLAARVARCRQCRMVYPSMCPRHTAQAKDRTRP